MMFIERVSLNYFSCVCRVTFRLCSLALGDLRPGELFIVYVEMKPLVSGRACKHHLHSLHGYVHYLIEINSLSCRGLPGSIH